MGNRFQTFSYEILTVDALFVGGDFTGPPMAMNTSVAFASCGAVHPGRIRTLKPSASSPSIPTAGPVVYWMFRDQRCHDNWALIHAVDIANRTKSPVSVVFNLFHRFLGAHSRQLGFMIHGLRQLQSSLHSLGIPFFLLRVTIRNTLFSSLEIQNPSLF